MLRTPVYAEKTPSLLKFWISPRKASKRTRAADGGAKRNYMILNISVIILRLEWAILLDVDVCTMYAMYAMN